MTTQLAKIISDQIPESLHLEFKRSILLRGRRRDDICKAVSAMANSDGGRIIFGISEDKSSNSYELDEGAEDGSRTIEWLDNVLSDNISPRILGASISCEEIGGKKYISVEIPKSANAPHQSLDKRFYKRSNNRSFPMEAYEIEDTRNRRLLGPPPLVVGYELNRGFIVHLTIFNRSDFICRKLNLEVRGNFKMSAFKNEPRGEVHLSRIGIGQRTAYILGSVFEILSEAADAYFEVSGTYFSEVSDKQFQFCDQINLGELEHSVIPQDVYGEHLKKIAEELHSVRDEVRQASSVNKEIAETISGAGIRISPYSLFQLHRAPESAAFEAFKYNAYGLTLEGMAEVLEVTTDVISELHQFQYFGGRGNLDEIISKLPVDVANRVRQRISFARR